MRFYLGTHHPAWLARQDVPLFISHRALARQKRLPKARTGWALDSGGFTELSMFGMWRTTVDEYIEAVRRYRDEIGRLEWAAPQDWMCEPAMLRRTGLTVEIHQAFTIANFCLLQQKAPDLPFAPVLQGWTLADYLDHVDQYAAAGIDLTTYDRVGLGSVCRRQDSNEIGEIISALDGLRLHGFGVKAGGLSRYGWMLNSADSLAWSYGGRTVRPCPVRPVASCANCEHHALEWRASVLAEMRWRRPVQGALPFLK